MRDQGSEVQIPSPRHYFRFFNPARLRTGVLECPLPPAPATGLIKLHQASVLIAARFGEGQFSGIEGTLAVKDFEIGGCATLVANLREAPVSCRSATVSCWRARTSWYFW